MRQTLFMEIADSRLHLSPMITHLDLHLMVLRKKFNISVIAEQIETILLREHLADQIERTLL